jgi:hypothetical protein
LASCGWADAKLGGKLVMRYAACPHFRPNQRRKIRRNEAASILIEADDSRAEQVGLRLRRIQNPGLRKP